MSQGNRCVTPKRNFLQQQTAMASISFLLFDNSAIHPRPVYPMSQGFDLMASENILIEKGKRAFVETNIAISLPCTHFAVTHGTSNLNGINAIVKSSVYDDKYSGTIRVLIENEGPADLPIMVGDTVATLIITPINPPDITVIISIDFILTNNHSRNILFEEAGGIFPHQIIRRNE